MSSGDVSWICKVKAKFKSRPPKGGGLQPTIFKQRFLSNKRFYVIVFTSFIYASFGVYEVKFGVSFGYRGSSILRKIPCFYDFSAKKSIFAYFHVYFQYIQICEGALTL